MPGCTGDPETVAARSYVARQALSSSPGAQDSKGSRLRAQPCRAGPVRRCQNRSSPHTHTHTPTSSLCDLGRVT